MKKFILLSFAMLFFLAGKVFSQAENTQYKIAQKFHLKDDGFWDYCNVDDATGLLYVSHNKEVQVVNVKNGETVATITGVDGVHGIALAPELNKGFISSGRDAKVLVFDLKTNATIGTVKTTGDNPDCILYDPFTKRVFTFNGRSSNSTVIDAKTLKVLGTIPLGGDPEFAQSDYKGKIYDNLENKSEIIEINAATMKVEHTWSIAPGEEPSGLSIDRETHRLFSVCRNKMMVVVNAETGKVITTLPTGGHTDGCAFDPGTKRAFSSNGEGTLTVVQEVDANTFKVLENVKTQVGARTITLDSKTHHIYLPTAEFGPAPAATADNPRPRPSLVPGSFTVLDIEPVMN